MIMLREGNATEDRVCVQASNSPTTTAPAVVHSSDPHLHYSTVLSNPHISSSTGEKVTEHHSSVSNTKFITPNMAYSDTSPAVSGSAPLITTIGDKSLRTGETQIHWLLLVVVILGGVLLYLWCRGRSLPSMNMWKGPTYEKYTQPPQDRNQHLVRPQGREPEGGVGLEGEGSPSPGGLQEVAVEPSGGEKISNTVGSIYIFSPGTVVLGSNKSDKKSNKGESGGEGYSLSSVPQQESRCLLPGGPDVGPEGMITQEETHKELCYPITELNYPVPATEN
ncbi:uncharacterized protein si:dkeyp-61b2.1 [Esox lucius]|uniref:uncharacterized protein si:dkeyp-61b2.1 n=1 Tax=Esox lucius TaxID=8010 RepID=UPI000973224B|nr:uncharacterized protein si:dkeyp-61b2.1 [Esox lucius]